MKEKIVFLKISWLLCKNVPNYAGTFLFSRILSIMERFFSPRTVKGDQLSLLDRVSSTPKTLTVAQLWDAVAGRAYTAMTAIPPAKPRHDEMKFHPEVSKIDKNYFLLYISYKGSSYELTWPYKRKYIRSFQDGNLSNTMAHVNKFDTIKTYRDGRYISAVLPRWGYDEFEKKITEIISNPIYNPSMTMH